MICRLMKVRLPGRSIFGVVSLALMDDGISEGSEGKAHFGISKPGCRENPDVAAATMTTIDAVIPSEARDLQLLRNRLIFMQSDLLAANLADARCREQIAGQRSLA
jgi:hypothetical protein